MSASARVEAAAAADISLRAGVNARGMNLKMRAQRAMSSKEKQGVMIITSTGFYSDRYSDSPSSRQHSAATKAITSEHVR